MECNIYDSTLTKIGIISSFVSMTWEEQYSDAGSFQLVVNKEDYVLELLKIGNFVAVRPFDTLMFIYSIEDKESQIWAHGAEAKQLLKTRIYDGTLICKNVEETLKMAVMEKRPLPIFSVTESRGLDETINSQRSYKSLFDMSKAWCDMAGYGFRLIHDRQNKKLLYDVYSGEEQQNTVFAEKYRNMYNLERTQSKKQMANVAYVAGEGEGEDRVRTVVGDLESEGWARGEIFVDAKDIMREEKQTLEDYIELLKARGLEELQNYQLIDEIDFEVDATGFGEEYSLGDIVTCLLPEYGLKKQVRITGFRKIYEGNVEKTELTLGVPILRTEV